MSDRLDAFGDAEIAVVMFDNLDRLGDYRTHLDLPDRIRVLADADRTAYAAMGVGRGSVSDVWGPKIWWSYAKLMARGRRFHRPTGDSLQLGGDFVIGPDQTMAYVFHPPDPDARPPVDDLIDSLSTT
ncbi:MAG TPA: peroxiredoxin-like family protein [Acidimicrobiales bacterium]|nr:peroxiredoxin-like family protein [Acidimicrobiales bacterium]